jgi:hypothetical protein
MATHALRPFDRDLDQLRALLPAGRDCGETPVLQRDEFCG